MDAIASLVLLRILIVGSNVLLLHAVLDSSEFLFYCWFSCYFLLSEAFLKSPPIHIKSEALKGGLEALSTGAGLADWCVSLWGNQVECARLYWTNLKVNRSLFLKLLQGIIQSAE